MKKLIFYFTATYLILTYFSSAYGQWNTNGILTGRYVETDNFPPPFNIRSVGIGNFTSNGALTNAFLHVNSNYLLLPSNGSITSLGEVFRTTGPSTNVNAWRMFTGAGNGIERFSITVPANSNNTVLQTQQPGSSIIINTNGTNERARFNQDGNLEVRTPISNPYPPGIAYDINAKVDVYGAIRISNLSGFANNVTVGRHGTVLYGATNMLGPPTGDGFRVRWDNHFFANFNEALIFEKTDFNQNFPNGGVSGIAFVNTGNDDIVRTAMVIKGNGRVGIGNVFGPNNKTSAQGGDINGLNTFIPKAILDVYSIDTSMVVNLRLTQTPHAQPNNGIFSDLQTTGSASPLGQGNLLLNPRHATDTGFVGINMYDTLANTNRFKKLALDVNGQQNLRWVNRNDSLPYVLVWDSAANGRIMRRKIDLNTAGGYFTCTDPKAEMQSNSRFNLNNYTFYFEDATNLTNDNNVGIGYVCGTPLTAKLDVVHNLNTNNPSFLMGSAAGRFINNDIGQGTKIGVRADAHGPDEAVGGLFTATSVGNFSANTGVYSHAYGSPNVNTGGYFRGNDNNMNATNYGVSALADGSSTFNFGVESRASGATTNYGVKTIGSGLDWNYGIHSFAGSGNFNYGIWAGASGINASSVVWAGWFQGNVMITGAGWVNGNSLITSDQQFKTNIDTISNASAIISQLAPKTFFFDTLNNYNLTFSSKKQYGFIAQDVEPILPELVSQTTKPAEYDSLGNIIVPAVTFKGMNYNAFIAILTKGMQEQQTLIDSLQSQITSLTNCLQPLITQLCGNNNNMMQNNNNNPTQLEQVLNTLNAELSHGDAIVLEQNVPNPFAENTSINYYIPENNNYAQLIFTDMQGRIIKTVDIKQTGKGQLKVYAANLSQGIYQYSIVVDGKIIDTKKVLVEK
ncbi:MAG: tail fiber domain-containing protein [Vicingaceae bacterium]|nr:MAG: tail fiber domain-containing protein [Vicingaceae bacterium]